MLGNLQLDNSPAMPSRRATLKKATTLLTLSVLAGKAQASSSKVLAVRTWPAQDYTRITLELSAPIQAEHFMLTNPNRLVLDLQGLSLSPTLESLSASIQADDPYIAAVRVAQNTKETLRVVLDLKQEVAPQRFSLKPIGDYQHRMVLDLYPKTPRDPLLALMQDLQEEDPLLDIIGNLSNKNIAENKDNKGFPDNVPNRKGRPILIAIDPGHGGEDPGAVGGLGTKEKDIVLAIGKKLRDLINAQPGMKAYMTRDADFFVPLHVRVQKARRVKADLFISIHADAFTNKTARGTSVFTLSQKGATSAVARWLAKKENAADMVGGVRLASHDKSTAKLLANMMVEAQIKDSLDLSHRVLEALSNIKGLKPRRVEQAGFAVLRAPDIPSILVETAFISNPQEERFLREDRNQQYIANAIFQGINRHYTANPRMSRG